MERGLVDFFFNGEIIMKMHQKHAECGGALAPFVFIFSLHCTEVTILGNEALSTADA